MTYNIALHNFGHIYLDGGSMFGSVPKTIWEKKTEPDQRNRIKLATNSLILRSKGQCILIDTGNGNKWDDKSISIYSPEYFPLKHPEEITDVILTHLHFDHAGGISYYDQNKELTLTYPNAKIFLQKANYTNACKPNLKERASYLKENIEVLDKANLILIDGSKEIYPGLFVHRIDGHTSGQQYIEIRNSDESYFYATDLIPTHHHLPLPYHLGYDMCAQTTLKEKQEFLEKAILVNGVVIFQHDSEVAAGKIGTDKKGHYCLQEEVKIPSY